jgi:hypothetical protein
VTTEEIEKGLTLIGVFLFFALLIWDFTTGGGGYDDD